MSTCSVPGAVEGVTVSLVNGSRVATVTWPLPSVSGCPSGVTNYSAQLWRADTPWEVTTTVVVSPAVSWSNLSVNCSYVTRVAADNAVGVGPFSANVSFHTCGVPDAPAAPAVTSLPWALAVTWTPPASSNGCVVTGYGVCLALRGDVDHANCTSMPGPSPVTQYTWRGLPSDTVYNVSVSAVNAAGVGAQSAWSSGVSTCSVPGAVTSVSTSLSNNTRSVTVRWSAPSVSGCPSGVADYSAQLWLTTAPSVVKELVAITDAAVWTNLDFNSSYSTRVRAVNLVGNGSYSPAITFSTCSVPTALPSAPLVDIAGDDTVLVTWQAVVVAGCPVLNYTLVSRALW